MTEQRDVPPLLAALIGRVVAGIWSDSGAWGFALGDAAVAIYYPSEVSGTTEPPFGLVGCRLQSLVEDADWIVLTFDKSATVRVTKAPAQDCGPEAMSIALAGGPIVVWR